LTVVWSLLVEYLLIKFEIFFVSNLSLFSDETYSSNALTALYEFHEILGIRILNTLNLKKHSKLS
jgi:hypothetical protein